MPLSLHHQDISPLYSDDVGTTSINSNSSSSNSSPTPLPHSFLQLRQHQQHQHQQLKSSPDSSSSLSSLSSSPPSSSNPRTVTSSLSPTPSLSLPGSSEEDVDMQPLDLSLRPRDELASKRPRVAEHKPICLVKSCVCNLGNTRAQRLSPYPLLPPGTSRSPNYRLTSSPRTDSPFYRQSPSPAYYGAAATVSSPYYIPPPSSSSTTESSSFQLLTTSNSVLNGMPNPPGLFRPYDDHIDSDIGTLNTGSPGVRQPEPPPPAPPQQQQQEEEEDEGPTYMDLDSSTQRSAFTKGGGSEYRTPSTSVYSQAVAATSLPRGREGEIERMVSSVPQDSSLQPAPSGTPLCDSTKLKTATFYGGGGASKIQEHQNRGLYPNGVSTSSDIPDHHHHHQQQQQQQTTYQPETFSSAGEVSSSSSLNLYPTPNTMAFPYGGPALHENNVPGMDGNRFCSVSPADQQLQQQQQSPSSSHPPVGHGGRNSPSTKENAPGNKNKKVARSANYFQAAIVAGQDSNIDGMAETKNKKNRERNNSFHRPSLEGNENNEDSSKISLMDYWISKFLMEQSAEDPSKACNTDVRCAMNGEKKLRFRLVDLIELKVEQSLKA